MLLLMGQIWPNPELCNFEVVRIRCTNSAASDRHLSVSYGCFQVMLVPLNGCCLMIQFSASGEPPCTDPDANQTKSRPAKQSWRCSCLSLPQSWMAGQGPTWWGPGCLIGYTGTHALNVVLNLRSITGDPLPVCWDLRANQPVVYLGAMIHYHRVSPLRVAP